MIDVRDTLNAVKNYVYSKFSARSVGIELKSMGHYLSKV